MIMILILATWRKKACWVLANMRVIKYTKNQSNQNGLGLPAGGRDHKPSLCLDWITREDIVS